ncbi:ABC transporter permease [Clostridium rectalis]|uniref:ABC transporter permease n=1 Tax=Clostridium rectalis TaxID=2040295 RepID=UPI000F6424BE|nr:ABC transporter permease [Clostridium rectalis]
MKLFNIALKNVKNSYKNYIIYFTSMVFSVTIYALFKSIEYNEQITTVSKEMKKVGQGFQAASYIIALFVFIFIWYSNSFFIRKRKREIGIYSLLGVKKKSIGVMMFYETMVMGILAMLIGICCSAILSKGFIYLFMKSIDAEGIIKATFTATAVYETIKTFLLIFLFISFHGATIIYKYELIDLFKAESKKEEMPKSSVIIAVLSVLLLITGYLIYIFEFENSLGKVSLITLITVVTGTYLFFSSFLVFYLKEKKRNEKKYYNGLNMISNSQLMYRIKGNSMSLATIAILIATTLTSLGFSISYYTNFAINIDKENPFDYVIENKDKLLTNKIDDLLVSNNLNKLRSKIVIKPLVYEGKSKDGRYESENIMSESDFNKILKARNLNMDMKLSSNNDVFIIKRFVNTKDYIDKVQLRGSNNKYNVVKMEMMYLINSGNLDDVVIVKDNQFNKLRKSKEERIYNLYLIDNHRRSGQLSKEFTEIISDYIESKGVNNEGIPNFKVLKADYYNVYKEEVSQIGTLFFIGSFVGLVFLICTASIIFFKQISEANEEKARYKILLNIGIKKSEIKKSIYKQMAFVFFIPLVVGVCHGTVALSKFGKWMGIGVFTPIVLTAIPYTIIYLLYYLLTVKYYYKTIIK